MSLKFPSMLMTAHSSHSFQSKDANTVAGRVNTALNDVTNRVNFNRLCVNVEKTSCLVFSYRGEANVGDIVINDEIVKRQNFVKYLGFNLNNHLTLNNHIGYVFSRILKAVGFLYKLNGTVPLSALRSIYFI